MLQSFPISYVCKCREAIDAGKPLPVLKKSSGINRLYAKFNGVISKYGCIGSCVDLSVQNELKMGFEASYAGLLSISTGDEKQKILSEIESGKKMIDKCPEMLIAQGIIKLKKTYFHCRLPFDSDRVTGHSWKIGLLNQGYVGVCFTTSNDIDMDSRYVEMKMAFYYKCLREYERLNINKIVLLNFATDKFRVFSFTDETLEFQMSRIKEVLIVLKQQYSSGTHLWGDAA